MPLVPLMVCERRYLAAWLVSRVPALQMTCTLHELRALNVICGLLSILVIKHIIGHLRPSRAAPGVYERVTWTEAVAVATFPLHFFFWFLFYTDAMSTLLVLAAFLCALQNRVYLCALVKDEQPTKPVLK